jgi:hypothetical protein
MGLFLKPCFNSKFSVQPKEKGRRQEIIFYSKSTQEKSTLQL